MSFDLKTARLDRGLSQRELAEQAGVGRETVRRLEDGGQAYPANAKKLADFLGVRVTDLLGANDEAEVTA